MIDQHMDTTAFDFEGYRIAKYLGVVRGITVRSRSIVGQMGASIQQIFGGNIRLYTEMCDHARQEAYALIIQHAEPLSGHALFGAHYAATEIHEDVAEVLAYGTAVVVEPTT